VRSRGKVTTGMGLSDSLYSGAFFICSRPRSRTMTFFFSPRSKYRTRQSTTILRVPTPRNPPNQ
jgi:hypothetical protein